MEAPHHLLVVDDDPRLAHLLSRYLKDAGFWVSVVEQAHHAQDALALFQFDLMILDIMMPGISGLTFLENNQGKPMPPVLLLTAQGGIEDRVKGLKLGADDYLVKPFDPRELILRIQAILRRIPLSKIDPFFGGIAFDKTQGLLFRGDVQIPLTISEHRLLQLFLAHPGEALSRHFIASHLGEGVNPRTVDVQVNRLRQKIEPIPSHPRYLQSLRGQGYVLRPTP